MPAFLLALLVVLCLPFSAFAQNDAAGNHPEAPGARRFAVTLLSSFDPIPQSLLPTDVPKKVYRTQASVFGRTIHFARVGFYATAGEAEAAKTKLLARYPAAFVTEITGEEYREATGGAPPASAPAPRAPATAPEIIAPKPAARDEIFVVTLAADAARAPQPTAPLPDSLRGHRLYTRALERDGKAEQTLNLGFFATPTEAERARRLLRADYPEARVRLVTAAERDASTRTAVRAPSPATRPPTPVTPATPPSPSLAAAGPAAVESEAITLIDRARDALTRGDNNAAIQILSQLLQLPPNRQSQEAQELIGLAHERNGEATRARREYELYLKLYPEGAGADRVRQRLASLDSPATGPKLKAAKKHEAGLTTLYGGFSQYYYYGNSRIETTTQTGPTFNQDSLTLTDQSALITNLDLNGRIRRGDWDNRVVIRDTYTWNFLEGTENQNRLYAAYGELRNKPYDYGGRFGRQPGNTGGVLGRFDGVSLGYGFLPKWRLNVVAGEPVEFTPINSDKLFWGTSVDFGTFAEHWSGNLYYMQQTVDGILDRQAVGTEVRYFDPQLTVFSLIDYDLSFGELNIGMLQLTKLFGTHTTINALIDHRKAPVLQTSNAVIGEVDTSIKSQLQTLTEEQLRAQAEDRTPTADLYMLGVNHNFGSRWQLGGDIKLYNISGTPASGALPETIGTGNILVYTLQGIATGLLTKRDISVLSLSYIDSRSYTGQSASLSYRSLFQDKWTFDAALRYYTQQDSAGTDLSRWSPNLRLGYRWRDRLTLEGEYGYEKTLTESMTTSDDSSRHYFSLGYRWDF